MSWLRRLRDWWTTRKTLAAVAERECRHDGRDPMCDDCIRDHAGW